MFEVERIRIERERLDLERDRLAFERERAASPAPTITAGELSPKMEAFTNLFTGPQGERGVPGIPGVDGQHGERGEKGDTGERGADGRDGATGAQGRRGVQGPRGDIGLQGPVGQRGERGEKGEDGKAPQWRGEWKSGTLYKVGDIVSFEGSTWIALAPAPSEKPGSNPAVWGLVALKGSDGRPGGRGPDLADTTPAALGVAAPGTSGLASRADHVHEAPEEVDLSGYLTSAAAAAAYETIAHAAATYQSIASARTKTTAALDLYVDGSLGNDANPGSAMFPFATIQAAFDLVNGKEIRHTVDITILAGNYKGGILYGILGSMPSDGSVAYLRVRGTQTTATPATGSATGTLTGYSAASGSTASTFTDSGALWTVNDHVGKFLWIEFGTGSGASRIYPITANTGTAITVDGATTTSAAGATYRILQNATIINTPNTDNASTPFGAGAVNYFGHGINIVNCVSGGPQNTGIIIEKIATSLSTTCVTVDSSTVAFQWMKLGGTNGVTAINGARVRLDLSHVATTLAGIQCSSSFGAAGGVQCAGTFFNGGARGVVLNSHTAFLTNCTFKSHTAAGITSIQGSGLSVQVTGCRIDAAAIGIGSVASATSATGSATFGVSAVAITNCTTAGVRLHGPQAFMSAATLTGTGNTIGLDIAKGARAQLASTVSLTGTTEISLDGTTTDLATMRAASPKVLTSGYLTAVYE
jgi:hypothetical protein